MTFNQRKAKMLFNLLDRNTDQTAQIGIFVTMGYPQMILNLRK
jgi:hypothetical protein